MQTTNNMHPMYVSSDHYKSMKKSYDEMGIDCPMIPVDMNGAFVPQSKEDPKNLQKASEANLYRHGLTEDGL